MQTRGRIGGSEVDTIDEIIAAAQKRQTDPVEDWERVMFTNTMVVQRFRGQPGVYGRATQGGKIEIIPRDFLGTVEAIRRGVLRLSDLPLGEAEVIGRKWGLTLRDGPKPIIVDEARQDRG